MNERTIPESADDLVLNRRFVQSAQLMRLLTVHLAELAVRLADQAGEAVQRPLSEEQLRRALDVNTEEADHIEGMIWSAWHASAQAGDLPESAFPN